MKNETLFDKLVRESREREKVATPGLRTFHPEETGTDPLSGPCGEPSGVSVECKEHGRCCGTFLHEGDAAFAAGAMNLEPAWRECLVQAVFTAIEVSKACNDVADKMPGARLIQDQMNDLLHEIDRILAERTGEK